MTDYDRWLTTQPEPDLCPQCDGDLHYSATTVTCQGCEDEPPCGWSKQLPPDCSPEPDEDEVQHAKPQ